MYWNFIIRLRILVLHHFVQQTYNAVTATSKWRFCDVLLCSEFIQTFVSAIFAMVDITLVC